MADYSEAAFEFYRTRERHTAYVLSAAAASIALAMTFADRPMSRISSSFFLAALAFWGLSFLLGVLVRWRQIRLFHKTISIGENLPRLTSTREEFDGTRDQAGEHLVRFDRRTDMFHLLQMLFLLLGGIGFVAAVLASTESFQWLWEKAK